MCIGSKSSQTMIKSAEPIAKKTKESTKTANSHP